MGKGGYINSFVKYMKAEQKKEQKEIEFRERQRLFKESQKEKEM